MHIGIPPPKVLAEGNSREAFAIYSVADPGGSKIRTASLRREISMPNISPEERDKISPVWDMSQERAFIENLLGQRFNFFLIFFSLVVAGALNARSQVHFSIVLILGAIICWLLAFTLFRSQQKLDLILAELFADQTHPASIIDKKAGGLSMRRLIGYVIPLICCIALTLGTILALCGTLRAGILP
jgi:hypothetical protein